MAESRWHIVYCDQEMDPCPVTDFIDACAPKHQVKILRFLTLLEEMGPTLPRPYADLLKDGIHELRLTLSGDQVRMLYFFCFRKFIVFYTAFVKNTDRVPETFIQRVRHYRDGFLERVTVRNLEELVDAAV